MDHIQTERMREQIRREERTLEAWTLRYLSDEARSQYSEDLSKREGQYPPAQIWTGGPVQQLLEPTAEELAEEAARARELADRGQVKPDRHVLTRPPLDLTAPLPPGYMCALFASPQHPRYIGRSFRSRCPLIADSPVFLIRPVCPLQNPSLAKTGQPFVTADARHAHRVHPSGLVASPGLPRSCLRQAALFNLHGGCL